MPELPEVETVARLIRPSLEGRRIQAVDVRWLRSLGGLSRARFAKCVVGQKLTRIWRRAKYIVFDLENDAGLSAGCLVGHLRMTGRMHVEHRDVEPNPYTRISLDLDDGNRFHFIDVRKFGRLTWAAEPGQVFARLGPEPLGEQFNAEWFSAALRERKRMLKPLLLDQSFLAGLGNIYVDESLFQAGLHPLRRSDRVPRARAFELHAAIQSILRQAIEREGSSFDTFYRTPEGQPGSYQAQFQVYGRTGKPCRTCGRSIRKITVGQRGTHLCTRCQPAPRAKSAT